MNLPNKLTVLRILLVPVFVVFYAADWDLAALIVFAAASLTDTLDGHIARSRGLITTFGKLMDPLADKILVMAAMLCFVDTGVCPAWVVIVILAREFLVTSLRLVAAGEGLVIAADVWGKLKTVAQMLWIVCGLLSQALANAGQLLTANVVWRLSLGLMWIAAGLALLSGINYCVKNRSVFLRDL
mgnify:CR=1 FL=1